MATCRKPIACRRSSRGAPSPTCRPCWARLRPRSTWNSERWYYVSNQTQEYTWHEIQEVERLVVVIEFDKSGKITSVKKLNLADGKEVAMVERTTPTSGQGLSLLGQLLGNIGRFEGETK